MEDDLNILESEDDLKKEMQPKTMVVAPLRVT
jgi:hypothetical protein